MRFKLEIELGNDAMKTSEDISSTLLKVAEEIGNQTIEARRKIRDLNGNTVGFYEVIK